MPTLYVRNFPDDLHRKIRRLAARHRRSVGDEVIVLIDHAVNQSDIEERRADALRNIATRRRSCEPAADAKDGLTMLREDRQR